MNNKKTFLEELEELSDFDVPSIYRALGMSVQLWSYYKRESPQSFPLKLLPSLQYHSGMEEKTFFSLVRRHFPIVDKSKVK